MFLDYQTYRSNDLHTDGMEKLTPPGVESNWLDWSYLMETVIGGSIYRYVMMGSPSTPPPSHYEADKAKVCSVLVRYVDPVNRATLRKYRGDPKAQWRALKHAHESITAGSRIFWLDKLITF